MVRSLTSLPVPARRRWAVVTAAVVIAAAGGAAWAVIPDNQGTYTGCYSTTSSPVGRLRVVDPSAGQTCGAGEVQIQWNTKGISWRGTWGSATAYKKNDAVTRAGSSYIAIAANTNQAPPNATYWNVLAQKGAPGTPAASYFDRREVEGPLPQTVSFTDVPAGRIHLRVEGTAFASSGGRYWVYVTPNNVDTFCGGSSRYPTLYFNQTSVHMHLMPMDYVYCSTGAGDVTVHLEASDTELLTDGNDFFTVVMTVYPDTVPPLAPSSSAPARRQPPWMTPG